MADASKNGSQPALSSDWGGLSPFLIASFFAVKKVSGKERTTWIRDLDQPEVRAPITDGNVDITQNWQSPFENVGPDQKFSSFSALLQAGGFASLMSQLKALFPNSDAVDAASAKANSLEGRSNLTKLNSTQVFNGMPPMKISVTAHFRAFKDAASEVRDPMNQLIEWAVPQEIAPDGVLSRAIGGTDILFPSRVPQIIGMKYADMLFAPIVIEAAPYPLTTPRDSNGITTVAAMQLQLASLTALDRQDWQAARSARNRASFGF